MILSILLFLFGVLLLIKGSSWLVEGASSLAQRLKISPLVIGLTVVAFGTSAPELLVSVTGAVKGSTDIALGNVVGSNILNILLILGLAAIFFPLSVKQNTVWKEIPMSFLAVVILTVLGIQGILDEKSFDISLLGITDVIGGISFSNGLVLLSFFIIFLYYSFGVSKEDNYSSTSINQQTVGKSLFFLLIGMVGLAFGSTFTVDNALFLARNMGFSENFVGLTVVALGTSLPELFTSVTAALKKNADIAVGNVVGSNIFNIFLILGITSLIKPIPLSGENLTDILVLFASTLFLFLSLFVFKRFHVGRLEGVSMIALYFAYLAFLFLRG